MCMCIIVNNNVYYVVTNLEILPEHGQHDYPRSVPRQVHIQESVCHI